MMIRKTTTFIELLANCPFIHLNFGTNTPAQAAAWLESRLAEKGILLAVASEIGYDTEETEKQ